MTLLPLSYRHLPRNWRNIDPSLWRGLMEAQANKTRRKIREAVKNRNHQKRAGGGGVTPEEWQAVLHACGNKCLSCDASPVTMDHVIPLHKDGKHHIDNIQPLCLSCNSTKGTNDWDYRTDDYLLKLDL